VTPSWYPSKKESGKVVPTWNYAVVHAQGNLCVIDDPEWLRRHVAQMTNTHEPTYESSWKLDDAPEEYIQMMLRAIVGIEIQITSLVGKFKLSQNRSAQDYAAVLSEVKNSPDKALQVMASYMKPD
jgi:transcriptional regulator